MVVASVSVDVVRDHIALRTTHLTLVSVSVDGSLAVVSLATLPLMVGFAFLVATTANARNTSTAKDLCVVSLLDLLLSSFVPAAIASLCGAFLLGAEVHTAVNTLNDLHQKNSVVAKHNLCHNIG